MARPWIYYFGNGQADGSSKLKNLLGGKGANLAEMVSLNIPVPPGFTITTEVCTAYYENDHQYPEGLDAELKTNLSKVEAAMGRQFGDAKAPLLLSVRSGARVSMPGMMDTVLNLGLNDQTVAGLAKAADDERFALDSYRRFIQMYSDVVLGLDRTRFENLIEGEKEKSKVRLDTHLSAENWRNLVQAFKEYVKRVTGKEFPQDPMEQLWGAVGAVFKSWMNKRAIEYRRINQIPAEWGTAVNVQAMVFGNMGNDCATGVAFTRDPATGAKKFFGEFLINAQGEDVVAGIRTPQPINNAGKTPENQHLSSMEEVLPECYQTLEEIYQKLERHYKDMQDIEFTIERGKVWMLQTRTGKRTAQAAVKIAVDMAGEKLIDKKTAILRVDPAQIDQLLHPMLDPKAKQDVIAKGLPASPGAASGQVVFTAEEATKWYDQGRKVILVRLETSPEDIHGMHVAQGILTARGGMTSHAAVVARGMGKCCVSGCEALQVDHENKKLTVGEHVISEGDFLTLNGSTGDVILGEVPTVEAELSGDFGQLMEWVDEFRTLKVRANADTPKDAGVARRFGAEGIGLCRTEHMFFEEDRIDVVREMILADDTQGRRAALEKLRPMQTSDFVGIFREMKDVPVTIRLLDPPLHEFLPHGKEEIEQVAGRLGLEVEKVQAKLEALHEFNPMLGHRGCRLGVTYPEIYEMQARAIMEAAVQLVEKEGFSIIPEIMIPLVGHVNELKVMRQVVSQTCEAVLKETKAKLTYLIGTMIELPRAALTADEVAKQADFFSFGTNDLTQTTFGFSRDDVGKFLPVYLEQGILPRDPFVGLDLDGVGRLVRHATELGRKTKPDIKLGICGEHGGDPASVHFCHQIGLNYVSCSPYRVPVARLAAAHAVLKES